MPMERMLFPDKYKSVCLYIEPDYPYIHRELAKHGVTLTLLWEEYRRKCYDEGKKPYMFTQFGEKYRKWARVTKATMRIQHKPGDAIEVDWAGDTIPIFDSVTGEQSKAYLFVAVLPCSYFAYAEFWGVCEQYLRSFYCNGTFAHIFINFYIILFHLHKTTPDTARVVIDFIPYIPFRRSH